MGEFTKQQLLYSIVGLFVGSLVLGLFLVLLVPPKTHETVDLSEGREKFCGECRVAAAGSGPAKVCATCGNSPSTNIAYAMIGPSIALLVVALLLAVYYTKKRRAEAKELPSEPRSVPRSVPRPAVASVPQPVPPAPRPVPRPVPRPAVPPARPIPRPAAAPLFAVAPAVPRLRESRLLGLSKQAVDFPLDFRRAAVPARSSKQAAGRPQEFKGAAESPIDLAEVELLGLA